MDKTKNKHKTVDGYINSFPKEKQELLQNIRNAIRKAAPKADEGISYQIPTYQHNGVLLSFALYDKHLGLYPTPSGIEKFKSELSVFKSAKGSVQFPLDKPIPIELIQEITKFKVAENSK